MYVKICDNMTSLSKHSNRTKRISLTLSEEELAHWSFFNTQANLSAFIREAVNSYITSRENEAADLKSIREDLSKNHSRMDKIEGDLLEIQAELAKHNILLESDVLERRIIDFIANKSEFTRPK